MVTPLILLIKVCLQVLGKFYCISEKSCFKPVVAPEKARGGRSLIMGSEGRVRNLSLITCIWTHSAYDFELNNYFISEYKGKTLYFYNK